MVPEKKSATPKEAFIQFQYLSESAEVKRREAKRKHPFLIREYEEGVCTICGGRKKIFSAKHQLCTTCYVWCRLWLKKKYGSVKRQFFIEAIIAATKPVKCKFYNKCGNELAASKNGKLLKLNVCDDCYPIWADGVQAGRNRKVRLRRYG